MCVVCADSPFESWDHLCDVYNEQPGICRCYPITREKFLPTGPENRPGKFFLWEILLNKDLYPSFRFIQIGIGHRNEFGSAQKELCHFICENGTCQWQRVHGIGSQHMPYLKDEKEVPCSLQVGFWTDYPAVQFRRGDYTRINEFRGFQRDLYPIAAVGTEYGTIDLIDTNKVPSLLSTVAGGIVKRMRHISGIDTLMIPTSLKMELKQAWIRRHAIIFLGPPKWCTCTS